MIRTAKPKNARSKRVLEKRQPKELEPAKTAIFVRGTQTSAKVNTALTELQLLKKPDSIGFNKKNQVLPFEDTSSFEFWSAKNDASLFVVGSHQKKRPDNLTWIRMFDGQVLDMLEMGMVNVKGMKEFKGPKPGLGLRPLFHFSGPPFSTPTDATTSMVAGAEPTEHDPTGAYQQFKSMIIDMYRGEELKENQISLGGLQHIICVTAAPISSSSSSDPNTQQDNATTSTLSDLYKAAGLATDGQPLSLSSSSIVTSPANTIIHFRVYMIQLLASGSKIPRVELTECGPSLDFVLRRRKPASVDRMNQALKRPKTASEKNKQGKDGVKKNIDTDEMGDMIGRVHVGKQDLGQLQTRKMKGLKKGKEEKNGDNDEEDSDEEEGDDEDDDDEEDEEDSDDEEVDSDEQGSELEMEDHTLPNSEDEEEEEEEDSPPPSKKSRRR